jgi:hypothetical protein
MRFSFLIRIQFRLVTCFIVTNFSCRVNCMAQDAPKLLTLPVLDSHLIPMVSKPVRTAVIVPADAPTTPVSVDSNTPTAE